MSVTIVWRSMAFLGWSSSRQSSSRQNTIAGRRHEPRIRKGISSVATEAAPASSSSDQKLPTDAEDDFVFSLGQSVIVIAPPKLAGTTGIVVGSALGDALEVRLQSGSVFNILAQNLRAGAEKPEGRVPANKVPSGLKRSPSRQAEHLTAAATAALAAGQSTAGGVDSQAVPVSSRPAAAALALDAVQSTGHKPLLKPSAVQTDLKDKALPEVILYSRDSCQWCSSLSAEYQKHGIKYRKVDITDKPNQREMWSKVRAAGLKGGRIGLPVVDIAGTVRVRPTAADVEKILSISGVRLRGGAGDEVIADLAAASRKISDVDKGIGSAVSEDSLNDKLNSFKEDEAQETLWEGSNGRADADEKLEPASSDSGCDAVKDEFLPGQEVVVLAPPTLAGDKGTINGPILGDTVAVRLRSGSIFQIPTKDLRDVNQAAGPGFLRKLFNYAKRATRSGMIQKLVSRFQKGTGRQVGMEGQVEAQDTKPQAARESKTSSSATEKAASMDEMELAPGQRVVVLGPPAAAGKKASVLSRVPGGEFEVQFEGGGVFKIAASNLEALSDGSTHAVGGGGAGTGDGSGKDRSGKGGGGEGLPPGNTENSKPDPESGGAAWLWWLAFTVLATLMVISSWKRRGRRNHSPSRVGRRPFVHTGTPASMDPMLALLVLVSAVSAVLIIKLVLWAREDMPGILESVVSCLRAKLASIFEVMGQADIEVLSAPEVPELAGSRMHLVGLLLCFVVVAIIAATWRKRKGWLGKDKSKDSDLAVVQKRRILRHIEPEAEEAPKPHADSPEVHFRCIMLVAKCRLFVAGNCESLGGWDIGNSIFELKSDDLSHPVWTGKWYPRAESSSREFKFKLVLLRPDGQVLWEDTESRKLRVSPREKLSVEITFNCAGMQVIRDFKAVTDRS